MMLVHIGYGYKMDTLRIIIKKRNLHISFLGDSAKLPE